MLAPFLNFSLVLPAILQHALLSLRFAVSAVNIEAVAVIQTKTLSSVFLGLFLCISLRS
jgi:hypothetical protein